LIKPKSKALNAPESNVKKGFLSPIKSSKNQDLSLVCCYKKDTPIYIYMGVLID